MSGLQVDLGGEDVLASPGVPGVVLTAVERARIETGDTVAWSGLSP